MHTGALAAAGQRLADTDDSFSSAPRGILIGQIPQILRAKKFDGTRGGRSNRSSQHTMEAKGPGGRGARGEPRGAWCRSLRRRGEAIRGRERELEKQHSPKLTEPRIAFIDSFCTRRSDTDRNRRDEYDGP